MYRLVKDERKTDASFTCQFNYYIPVQDNRKAIEEFVADVTIAWLYDYLSIPAVEFTEAEVDSLADAPHYSFINKKLTSYFHVKLQGKFLYTQTLNARMTELAEREAKAEIAATRLRLGLGPDDLQEPYENKAHMIERLKKDNRIAYLREIVKNPGVFLSECMSTE